MSEVRIKNIHLQLCRKRKLTFDELFVIDILVVLKSLCKFSPLNILLKFDKKINLLFVSAIINAYKRILNWKNKAILYSKIDLMFNFSKKNRHVVYFERLPCDNLSLFLSGFVIFPLKIFMDCFNYKATKIKYVQIYSWKAIICLLNIYKVFFQNSAKYIIWRHYCK